MVTTFPALETKSFAFCQFVSLRMASMKSCPSHERRWIQAFTGTSEYPTSFDHHCSRPVSLHRDATWKQPPVSIDKISAARSLIRVELRLGRDSRVEFQGSWPPGRSFALDQIEQLFQHIVLIVVGLSLVEPQHGREVL